LSKIRIFGWPSGQLPLAACHKLQGAMLTPSELMKSIFEIKKQSRKKALLPILGTLRDDTYFFSFL